MAKLVLSDIENLTNEDSVVSTIKANNDAIETAMEKTLSRDGTTPNSMSADLDMNSKRILNLPVPVADTEPARRIDITGIAGATDVIALNAAVASATSASASATSSAALAEKWATENEDVAVTSGKFSARHWAIKSAASATTAAYREKLTADKIWYVSLTGNDTSGSGTIASPWYSVNYAMKYILTGVDCNGFAPVIQMAPGTYSAATYTSGARGTGFTPPGDLEWGGLTGTSAGIVANGGALVELSEPIIGKQITGGQAICLCSQGDANRTGDDVIIETSVDTISVLHGASLILRSLTLKSLTGACVHVTQGATVEIGQNVVFYGAAGGAVNVAGSGTAVITGNVKIRASTGSYYLIASGTGSSITHLGTVDNNYLGSAGAPHHFSTAYVVATQGGQVTYAPATITNTIGTSAVKYLCNLGGGLIGTTKLDSAAVGGAAGTVTSATFGWSLP